MAVGVAVARLEAVEAVLAGKAAVFKIRPTGLHIKVTRKMQTLPQRHQQPRHLQNQDLPRDRGGGGAGDGASTQGRDLKGVCTSLWVPETGCPPGLP